MRHSALQLPQTSSVATPRHTPRVRLQLHDPSGRRRSRRLTFTIYNYLPKNKFDVYKRRRMHATKCAHANTDARCVHILVLPRTRLNELYFLTP